MLFGEITYRFTLPNIKDLQEVLNAMHNDPSSCSGLIQKESIQMDGSFIRLEVTVLVMPHVAGEFVVKMFPNLEKVLFPLSSKAKEENKQ